MTFRRRQASALLERQQSSGREPSARVLTEHCRAVGAAAVTRPQLCASVSPATSTPARPPRTHAATSTRTTANTCGPRPRAAAAGSSARRGRHGGGAADQVHLERRQGRLPEPRGEQLHRSRQHLRVQLGAARTTPAVRASSRSPTREGRTPSRRSTATGAPRRPRTPSGTSARSPGARTTTSPPPPTRWAPPRGRQRSQLHPRRGLQSESVAIPTGTSATAT